MDHHSPNKLLATKYCFLTLGDDSSFFFLYHFFIFRFFFLLFYVILSLLIFTKTISLLSFYLTNFFFFLKITFIFLCSGMFRNVPCFIDARLVFTLYNVVRGLSFSFDPLSWGMVMLIISLYCKNGKSIYILYIYLASSFFALRDLSYRFVHFSIASQTERNWHNACRGWVEVDLNKYVLSSKCLRSNTIICFSK